MAGDSAGGGLTVALLVATRDAGEALPAVAVLMSPTVDLTSSGASMTERSDQDPISTPAMLRQFASDYLAGADPKTPLASPLFASLSGLPPLLVQVGTADLLLSDSERLARAAAEAGVDVTLEIGEGPPTSTSSCSAPLRQPRPPSRSGSSCGPGSLTRQPAKQWVFVITQWISPSQLDGGSSRFRVVDAPPIRRSSRCAITAAATLP